MSQKAAGLLSIQPVLLGLCHGRIEYVLQLPLLQAQAENVVSHLQVLNHLSSFSPLFTAAFSGLPGICFPCMLSFSGRKEAGCPVIIAGV